MASEERIPFLGDDEECDERKVQLASESDGVQRNRGVLELLGSSETHETESRINESVIDQSVSAVNIKDRQNAYGESSSVTNTGSRLASELVCSTEVGTSASSPVDVTGEKAAEGNQDTISTDGELASDVVGSNDKSSEVDTSASKPVDVTEDKTSNEGNQDTISTGGQLASKVVGSNDNSSETNISESKSVDVKDGTITDEGNHSTIIKGTKQVTETEKNVGVPSTSSESPFTDDKSKESALWYIHVLLVRGLPPREAGVSVLLTSLSSLTVAVLFISAKYSFGSPLLFVL
jgi:hypothetical protein